MSNRVSLADVARETGVSISAVSLALRGDISLPLKTRRRIQKAATKLGYRPNPILAALASNHFRESGRSKGTPLAYVQFSAPVEGAAQLSPSIVQESLAHGNKLGYRLETYNMEDFRDGAHLSRVLFARGVQGIVLAQSLHPDLLKGMNWKLFSVVALGEGWVEAPFAPFTFLNRASVDHFGVALAAWAKVRERGYNRIGFALSGHSPPLVDDDARLGAAEVCRRRTPANFRIPPLIAPGHDIVGLVKDWVKQYRPEVVIGFNSWILWNLLEAGIRVPEDVGFVALTTNLGDEPGEKSSATQIAGMKETGGEHMKAAIELLDQQIRQHHYGLDPKARSLLIHSEWIEGDTLPVKS